MGAHRLMKHIDDTTESPHDGSGSGGQVAVEDAAPAIPTATGDTPVADTPRAPATAAAKEPPRRTFLAPRTFAVLMTVVLLLQVNIVLQANRRYWDVQSDGYGALTRVERCESLGATPDVLYLGSSRVVYGVNPNLIDDQVSMIYGRSTLGCNTAAFGSTFEEDYYTLKRFIADGYIPKLLVENLWEFNLNVNSPDPADHQALNYARVKTLADMMDAPTIAANHASGAAATAAETVDMVAARSIPLYGDRIGIYSALCHGSHIGPCGAQLPGVDPQELHDYQTSDPQGFIAYSKTMQTGTQAERDSLIAHLRQLYQQSNYHFKVGGHEPDFLRQLIELARAHGIQVVCVVSPMSQWYFKYAFQPGDWPMIAAYWHSFCGEMHAICYDLSHSPAFTDADFEDPHHLNTTGANKFSAWLAQNVVGPWAFDAKST